MRRRHSLLLNALIVVMMLAGGGYWGYREVQRALDRPVNITGEMLFPISAGQSVTKIAQALKARGWLSCALCWRLEATHLGLATRIQAGTYAVTATATPRSLLHDFVTGNVKQYKMTIVEGSTFHMLRAHLAGLPGVEITTSALSDEEVMAKIGVPDALPEGQFFPSTFDYPHGTRDVQLLDRAYQLMQTSLNGEWSDRSPDLPYRTPYEALTMASIIEKETAKPEERQQIAGVFVRRLQSGIKLQTDPTVIYGLGEKFDGNLRRNDLTTDTPYNTYTRTGLPPTPIALPGLASIRAALHPAAGDALYFVARGDGTHEFSATLAAHNDAVKHYQLNPQDSAHGPR